MNIMTDAFLNTLSRLAALRYGIEFIPGPCDVYCIVRDYDGRRYVSKRISSYDGLSLIGLDPEAHIFKIVDDAIDELEATDTQNEVNK